MFHIKWVTHFCNAGAIEAENSIEDDLDRLVSSCIANLPKMRMKLSGIQPDGFLILDDNAKEIRRWFGSPAPLRKVTQFHIQNNPRKIVFFSEETITWCKTIPQKGRRCISDPSLARFDICIDTDHVDDPVGP